MQMNEKEIIALINSYSNSLQLGKNVIETSERIFREGKEKYLFSGKKPEGVAAAIIYISCILTDNRRSQSKIAKIAKIPESTIRNRYLDLVRKLNIKREQL